MSINVYSIPSNYKKFLKNAKWKIIVSYDIFYRESEFFDKESGLWAEKSSPGHLECRWSSCGSSSCWRRSLAQHPELLHFSELMVTSSSFRVPSNEHSKRDDGWLMSHATKWSKQKRRWIAHVAFYPNDQSKRYDGWLMSRSVQWANQKRRWVAY